jgi:hypothetical protein
MQANARVVVMIGSKKPIEEYAAYVPLQRSHFHAGNSSFLSENHLRV